MQPVDQLKETIGRFIRQPFPLWETALTAKLVRSAYDDLDLGSDEGAAYGTANTLTGEQGMGCKQFLVTYGQSPIYLEEPGTDRLAEFYEEHGLLPLKKRDLIKVKAATKLKAALTLLATVPECINCVARLVNCIQVIASEGPDYDTSYSHPDLPFTIFVSICGDDDEVSSLRVAEGILHEAMHLKLSLIQRHIELTYPGTTETFYSPWRNVPRPLMGVLHGLFVFRAIFDFCKILQQDIEVNDHVKRHAAFRMSDIAGNFHALNHFNRSEGLTLIAKEFASKLQSVQFDR